MEDTKLREHWMYVVLPAPRGVILETYQDLLDALHNRTIKEAHLYVPGHLYTPPYGMWLYCVDWDHRMKLILQAEG